MNLKVHYSSACNQIYPYFCTSNGKNKMEIVSIYPPYIYSIKYDECKDCEFDRLFDCWNDVQRTVDFFMENAGSLNRNIWGDAIEPEAAARRVLNEAERLEDLFSELNENTKKGKLPDYDSHFKYLDGKYFSEIEYVPMKSYGVDRPSFLRIYAIKLERNTYVVTGGGIKLARSIQESPGLIDIIRNIDRVREWLKENGIFDTDDLSTN